MRGVVRWDAGRAVVFGSRHIGGIVTQLGVGHQISALPGEANARVGVKHLTIYFGGPATIRDA
jgi:hypothetical protein